MLFDGYRLSTCRGNRQAVIESQSSDYHQVSCSVYFGLKPDTAPPAVLGDQSGELLTGVTADLHGIADHHPFSSVEESPILGFDRFSLNPVVAGVLVAD